MLEFILYKLRPDLAGIGKAGANVLLNLALFQAVRTVQAY